jgi:hypothetical protein
MIVRRSDDRSDELCEPYNRRTTVETKATNS